MTKLTSFVGNCMHCSKLDRKEYDVFNDANDSLECSGLSTGKLEFFEG